MSAPIRFKRLRIERLFGTHDIDIPFRLDERMTVLHGLNGSGKTVTLRLIAALCEGRYSDLGRYPFKRLVLDLTGEFELAIETVGRREVAFQGGRWMSADGELQWLAPDGRMRPLPPPEYTPVLCYFLRRFGDSLEEGSLDLPADLSPDDLEAKLKDQGVRRIADDHWKGPRERESVSSQQLIDSYWDVLVEGPLLEELRESLPSLKFIQADRLHIEEIKEGAWGGTRLKRSMVNYLSEKIRALVKEADKAYRQISTELDTSLARRIFDHPDDPPELDDLRRQSRALRDSEARLASLGLLLESGDAVDEAKLKPEQRGTFYVLLQDRRQKLEPFAKLAAKAERLLDSLNRKLAPKKVLLNVDTGYQVLTPSLEPLPLDRLSSGEQHELVLLHELLFDVEPNTLVLIDEPELSLHVTWQAEFLDDMLDIARIADIDILIATHAPVIIGNHHDLLVELKVEAAR